MPLYFSQMFTLPQSTEENDEAFRISYNALNNATAHQHLIGDLEVDGS